MATVKLITRKTGNKRESLIFLQYCHNSKTKLFSTGQQIEERHWNSENQKVKKSYPSHQSINAVIYKEKERLQNIVREALFNDIVPECNFIKESYNKKQSSLITDKKQEIDFLKCYENFITSSKSTKKETTIWSYTTLKNHLEEYSEEREIELTFKRINRATFYDSFVEYQIEELHLTNNTIGKYILTLKTFLNYCHTNEIIQSTEYKKFKVLIEETDLIYLTEEELDKIYKLDLKKEKKLEEARDLFCLSCFTGLRYSDVTNIESENIKEDNLILRTQKTFSSIIIPLTETAKAILKKYLKDGEYKLPKLSNREFNERLKIIGKKAEIEDTVILTKKSGSKRIETSHKKYELITTHTGRRTFITLSLEKGMRPEVLMKITGHKSLKTLQRYIKITDKVKATEMLNVWNKAA